MEDKETVIEGLDALRAVLLVRIRMAEGLLKVVASLEAAWIGGREDEVLKHREELRRLADEAATLEPSVGRLLQ